ncbi:MAG: tetraacyldisaccharide 4'-kinase [Prevotella sp.]|nr:tetraacyldisaccharide 4'-kinase [Bacteroides sp.]MCM1365846.1 tetraacyldisaccharide 4'-kinase [Prevotella sp.]MCM1436462.1 tetraacyldisaccharide 4'-kinase [Prevotella sp.]
MKELDTIDTLMTYALTPLSWIYGAATSVRNKLFDLKILKEYKFNIPVISVGNITVGGTGKTPHVEYLISKLALEYRIGVVSRGYKRKTRGFLLANSKSTPDSIGDESYQIYQKFGHKVQVAVCEKRKDGIIRLLDLHPEINLIILDDAFQHRYVKPLLSILLVDYNRPTWKDKLLPLGRLRENRHSTDRADMVIVTKCPEELSPLECRLVENGLDLLAFQKFYFSRYEYSSLKPVFADDRPYNVSIHSLGKRDSVLLLTGIAHPRTFIRYFKQFPFKVKVSHFSDHHDFSRKDLMNIEKSFDSMKGERKVIITTEKDAVRLLNNPYFPESLKPLTFYLPIVVNMVLDKGDGNFIEDVRVVIGAPERYEEEEASEADI